MVIRVIPRRMLARHKGNMFSDHHFRLSWEGFVSYPKFSRVLVGIIMTYIAPSATPYPLTMYLQWDELCLFFCVVSYNPSPCSEFYLQESVAGFC